MGVPPNTTKPIPAPTLNQFAQNKTTRQDEATRGGEIMHTDEAASIWQLDELHAIHITMFTLVNTGSDLSSIFTGQKPHRHPFSSSQVPSPRYIAVRNRYSIEP